MKINTKLIENQQKSTKITITSFSENFYWIKHLVWYNWKNDNFFFEDKRLRVCFNYVWGYVSLWNKIIMFVYHIYHVNNTFKQFLLYILTPCLILLDFPEKSVTSTRFYFEQCWFSMILLWWLYKLVFIARKNSFWHWINRN